MRLDLTKRGDYAIRATLALARTPAGERLSARRIAEEQRIPVQILPRIMTDLTRAGLVVSTPGRTGGYELARTRASISVLDVIEAVEGDAQRRRCVLRGGPCRPAGVCDVHAVFAGAQDALLAALGTATLDGLADERMA
jgi:Rrf2 family transcriptional regulator, iron-sulfur cluster assembly transcription factor